MAFTGMTITEVRSAARELLVRADELETVRQQMSDKMAWLARSWSGSDANRFRSAWDTDRAALTRTIGILRSMSSELLRQADEQERTSAPSTISSPIRTAASVPLASGQRYLEHSLQASVQNGFWAPLLRADGRDATSQQHVASLQLNDLISSTRGCLTNLSDIFARDRMLFA